MELIKSKYTRVLKGRKKALVYHSLFGYPFIVSLSVITLLDLFENGNSLDWIKRNYKVKDLKKSIDFMLKRYFLIPFGFNERNLLKKRSELYRLGIENGELIDFLSLILAKACNFRCDYCFAHKKMTSGYRKQKRLMNLKTAKVSVDLFADILERNKKKEAVINFGGGEPLLNFVVLKQILNYCYQRWKDREHLKFVINTNASLISREIAETFKLFNVEITTSLDGLEEANDAVRVTKSDKGTFRKILKGWTNLEHAGIKLDGFCCTFNRKNFHLINETFLDFVAEKGMEEVRIDPDVVHTFDIPVTEIADKMINLRSYGKSIGVFVTGFWDRPFENLHSSFLKKRTAFCGGIRGNSLVIDPNGDVFLCGYSSDILGNIFDKEIEKIFDYGRKYYNVVTSRLVGEIKKCNGCEIEGQCVGGCYVAEEHERSGDYEIVSRNCELYKIMTQKLLLEELLNDERQKLRKKGGRQNGKEIQKAKET